MAADQAACQNCDWVGPVDECTEIRHLHERVAAGEIMPAGECPKCGCLCQLETGPQKTYFEARLLDDPKNPVESGWQSVGDEIDSEDVKADTYQKCLQMALDSIQAITPPPNLVIAKVITEYMTPTVEEMVKAIESQHKAGEGTSHAEQLRDRESEGYDDPDTRDLDTPPEE